MLSANDSTKFFMQIFPRILQSLSFAVFQVREFPVAAVKTLLADSHVMSSIKYSLCTPKRRTAQHFLRSPFYVRDLDQLFKWVYWYRLGCKKLK